jgi:hypothetical protein
VMTSTTTPPPVSPASPAALNGREPAQAVLSSAEPTAVARAEAERLATVERRLLGVIQGMVFGGVILLTVGAGALSWSHLTHIASTNGHIAPHGLLFVFPTIVDGFMVMGSGVVVRHALTDELGGRTWYAGALVAATASLSICLNIQDSTGRAIIPAWMLPGIAPALYMLGTELGLAELRMLMRELRARIQAAMPAPILPPEPPTQSKKDVVLAVLAETNGNVRAALERLSARGLSVDRSYVYEIRRELANGADVRISS